MPVRLDHLLIGYAWASVKDDAAGFLRNQRASKSHQAEAWWLQELARLHGSGLSPLEAMRARVGVPQDPVGGRFDATDRERTAVTSQHLFSLSQKGRLPPWRY